MFRRFCPPLAAIAITVAITVPATDAAAQTRVTDVAHRGASASAPENTLAAFRAARTQRADMFELDVQETKDHKLVIVHDTTLARTTNVESVFPGRAPWRVSDLTLAQIKRLDAGSWFARKYKGERVPTLDEVLTTMRHGGLGLLLEIKAPERYPGIERRVAAALKRRPWWLEPDASERRLVVQSFDWKSMERFSDLLPSVQIGLLGTPKVSQLRALARFADQINPTHGDLTASYVKSVHAHGMDMFTWTLNDPATMRKAIKLGVNGIITNKPAVLRKVLDGKSRQAA